MRALPRTQQNGRWDSVLEVAGTLALPAAKLMELFEQVTALHFQSQCAAQPAAAEASLSSPVCVCSPRANNSNSSLRFSSSPFSSSLQIVIELAELRELETARLLLRYVPTRPIRLRSSAPCACVMRSHRLCRESSVFWTFCVFPPCATTHTHTRAQHDAGAADDEEGGSGALPAAGAPAAAHLLRPRRGVPGRLEQGRNEHARACTRVNAA
jgi:hypothetical protein